METSNGCTGLAGKLRARERSEWDEDSDSEPPVKRSKGRSEDDERLKLSLNVTDTAVDDTAVDGDDKPESPDADVALASAAVALDVQTYKEPDKTEHHDRGCAANAKTTDGIHIGTAQPSTDRSAKDGSSSPVADVSQDHDEDIESTTSSYSRYAYSSDDDREDYRGFDDLDEDYPEVEPIEFYRRPIHDLLCSEGISVTYLPPRVRDS